MKYATSTAFRAALDERLKAEAKRTGLGLSRLRKRVAFELFLRRLLAVSPDRWILKGALALDFRLRTGSRSTRDVDIERADDETAATEDLIAAQETEMDDFFTFSATRTDELPTDEFSAARFKVKADLAGRSFEQFVLDIGFVDALPDKPEIVETPAFLSFAGIHPVRLPAIPIHQHIAEKVHAYTRRYGSLNRPSSRPKDLVDILLIEGAEPLDADELSNALKDTFSRRDTHVLPAALPPPPADWTEPFRRMATEVGLNPDLEGSYSRAATLLDPVMAGSARGAWDSTRSAWTSA